MPLDIVTYPWILFVNNCIFFTKFVYEYHLKQKIGLCCIYHDWQFHYISIYILKYQICWKSLISYHWSPGPECPGRVTNQVPTWRAQLSRSFSLQEHPIAPPPTCQALVVQSSLDTRDTPTIIPPPAFVTIKILVQTSSVQGLGPDCP